MLSGIRSHDAGAPPNTCAIGRGGQARGRLAAFVFLLDSFSHGKHPLHKPYSGVVPGVTLVRVGKCGPEEFADQRERIIKGAPGEFETVVKPKPGWEFLWSIEDNCYHSVRTGKKG